MVIIRTQDGRDLNVPVAEITGSQGTDGRFYVLLKDGTRGLWIRATEIEEEYRKRREALEAWASHRPGEKIDKRTGLEVLEDFYTNE